MIKKNGSKWELCQWKVIHKSHGNEQVHYTNDRDYWRDTIDKHDHLTDLEFEEMDFTSEQRERLKELNKNDVPESYMSVAREMVWKGIPNHDISRKMGKGRMSNVIAEHRVRVARRAVEQGDRELEDVDSKYRDKVEERLNKKKGDK